MDLVKMHFKITMNIVIVCNEFLVSSTLCNLHLIRMTITHQNSSCDLA